MNFYDREQLLNFFNLEEDQQHTLIQQLDLIESAYAQYAIKVSSFLSPAIVQVLKNIKIKNDFQLHFFGGNTTAERTCFAVGPEYLEITNGDYGLAGMKINYHAKFSKIGHRDVLGSLMSLGIKREKIGDIYVFEGHTDCIIKEDIYEYIKMSLKKIKNQGITIEKIPLTAVTYKAPEYKIIHTTLNSNRLDAIISKGFNLSREDSKKLVNFKKVKVNHQLTETHHEALAEGDLISVRTKGRMILHSINGKSQKDRLKVALKIYK
jgi:RNA-binding protein YlmH